MFFVDAAGTLTIQCTVVLQYVVLGSDTLPTLCLQQNLTPSLTPIFSSGPQLLTFAGIECTNRQNMILPELFEHARSLVIFTILGDEKGFARITYIVRFHRINFFPPASTSSPISSCIQDGLSLLSWPSLMVPSGPSKPCVPIGLRMMT